MPSTSTPDVFSYRAYRGFLREHYEYRKATEYGFSHRSFARRAGFKSPNYLKLVMEGKRNLTADMASCFAEACGLSGDGADYFCDLVAFDQAKTADERSRCYRRLVRFNRYRRVYRLDAAHEAYHGQWYIPVIRELITRADFDPRPAWIARQLLPRITAREAKAGMEVLKKLGMAVQDADGRWRQAEALVQTEDTRPLGHQVANFHRCMLDKAAEAIDRVPREEREIASLTMCIQHDRMLELKAHLERLRAELLQLYQPDEDAQRVVQVNLQMFPLSINPTKD